MATFTPAQVVMIQQLIDDGVTARRRSAAKSLRPEFKQIYDREIAELLQLKPLVEKVNGEAAGKGR